MEQVRATRDPATLRADRAYRIDSSPAFVVAAHRCLPSSNASFPREAAGILRFRLDERAPLPSTDRVRPSPQTDLATPAEPVRAEATQATTPPPPPYESVVLEEPPPADDAKIPDDPKRDRRAHASPETESTPPTFLGADGDVTVEVGKATKVGEGMSAYASYPVTASTTSSAFRSETTSVSRRFSDFTRLRKALRTAHPGVIVYPLPEKTVTTSPFHPEFLEQRRIGLDTFVRAVAAHPTLRRSEHLRAFLEDPGGGQPASEDPGGGASARDARGAASEASASVSAASSGARDAEKASSAEAWYQRGAAGTALSAVDGWFKSAAIAAESFVHGAGADTVLMEEEPDFLEASEYLLAVEDRLKRAARASDEVVSAVNSGGLVLGNLGDNAALLGDCEERGAKMLLGETAGGLGQAFRQVGAAAISLRAPTEAAAQRLAAEFRAPLRRALDLVHAAKETVDARAEALLRLQTARAQAEKRRAKLEAAVEVGTVAKTASVETTDGAADEPDGAASETSQPGGWFEKLASTTTAVVAAARGPAETVEDLQREAETAEAAREHARVRYEAIKATMRVEFPRLHAELESVLNAAFRAANAALRDLAGAQAKAWEAVMPGCSDVAALDPPPAGAHHAEGVGAAIARSLAGVMGSAEQGDSPKKAADGR